MVARARLVTVAYSVAFVVAGFYLILLAFNSVSAGLFFTFFLVGGIGILRRHVWSAYGLALVTTSQLLIIGINLLRSTWIDTPFTQIGVGILISMILIDVFFFAGRSLASSDAPRGRALPWLVVAILIFVPFLFVQAFVIPTGSMEDTLLIGDDILVVRFPRIVPKRGDMIVFRYPVDHRQLQTKRVIGVASDRIKITDKKVFRNGVRLEEPYALHKTQDLIPYRDTFPIEPDVPVSATAIQMLKDSVRDGEVVVPSGCYFVLGDNRDSSFDSRYWGFVREKDVIGKPLVVYFSRDTSTEDIVSQEPALLNFRPVRWNRILTGL
jgi:signal peptidase I